jgi:hypothetical protein
MSERDAMGQAGDMLIDTAKRNPEALLVLAAGCALLMRTKSAREHEPRHEGPYYREAEQRSRESGGFTEAARDATVDTANRVADATRTYASAVSDRAHEGAAKLSGYADSMRTSAAEFPERARAGIEGGFARVLREQPLAIAVLGIAAGATLAAILPATRAESQAFAPARDAMVDAASRAAENVKTAAGAAGEQLKQAARERGLHMEGIKDVARDVAGTFADRVAGGQTHNDPASRGMAMHTETET